MVKHGFTGQTRGASWGSALHAGRAPPLERRHLPDTPDRGEAGQMVKHGLTNKWSNTRGERGLPYREFIDHKTSMTTY